MKLPTDEQLERIFARFKKYARHRHPGGKDKHGETKPADVDPTPTLDELEEQLLSLFARATGPGPEIDGYGSMHGAADSVTGQATVLVEDEWGQVHAVAVTRVEATMFALDARERRPVADVVLSVAEKAYVDLLAIDQAYMNLRAKLDLARRLSSPLSRSETGGAGTCQACERDVTGSAVDRLKSGYCPACYIAWGRAGRPDRAQFAAGRRKVDKQQDTAA